MGAIRNLLLAGVLASLSGAAQAATYTVNLAPGSGSVVGFFETDGTLGQLSYGSILDWSLTITTNGGTDTINPGNAGFSYNSGSTAWTATATELLFDFSDPTGDHVHFQGGLNYATFLCIQATPGCGGGANGLAIGRDAGGSLTDLTPLSGVHVVATAAVSEVPLPAAGWLLVGGLAGLGAAARRRRKA
ncbi:VPLPA-CTERM sorting domain-containing protein [Pacificoceanicola onchidii]|uniref:VPLPA-CTERM sorting domain-containing protein n=1 Tax=Pacificoceanicola onchidii TaxID=2562685 RepID=UPI0010A45516|nr:VPLPA-CTERM sorting domain-containing protein [Pacificoceanicola onchidii]